LESLLKSSIEKIQEDVAKSKKFWENMELKIEKEENEVGILYPEVCYKYFINLDGNQQKINCENQGRYCEFYIGKMRIYHSYFSKVFFKNLTKKGYNKNETLFVYLYDFHPNGRGEEALNQNRRGFGSKVLNEVLKDCKEKNVKLIFGLVSTESSKEFFMKKHGFIQTYPKKRGIYFKEI